MPLTKYTGIILKKCMGLRENERILIVTDKSLKLIGQSFLKSALEITNKATLNYIPIPKVHGTEPPKNIGEEMLRYDVNILVTSKSLSHTKARKKASEHGVRIATLPEINTDILTRCIDIDYNSLKLRTRKITRILDHGSEVKIISDLGTDLVFSISGRKALGDDAGIYNKKGSFGNLPAGETYIAPIEGTANGIYVIDASFAGIGKLKEPIKVIVKKGFAVKFEGKGSKRLINMLTPFPKEAKNIAEFGIGTNDKAVISGNVLEDEKVLGTCHIALGNNAGFGGNVHVPIHLDGIIKKPTIYIDNKILMDKGKLII